MHYRRKDVRSTAILKPITYKLATHLQRTITNVIKRLLGQQIVKNEKLNYLFSIIYTLSIWALDKSGKGKQNWSLRCKPGEKIFRPDILDAELIWYYCLMWFASYYSISQVKKDKKSCKTGFSHFFSRIITPLRFNTGLNLLKILSAGLCHMKLCPLFQS